MKTLRVTLAALALLLLAAGYGASQLAALQGRAPEYARSIDQPLVSWIALAFLVLAFVLAFIKTGSSEVEP